MLRMELDVWTKLDELLQRMLILVPEWQEVLGPEDCRMVQQRVRGATFKDIAAWYGLSIPAVRARLYGVGSGGKRHGGALGRLRGRHMQNLRKIPRHSEASAD